MASTSYLERLISAEEVLRDLENDLISGRFNLSTNEYTETYSAIKQLLQCIDILRQKGALSKDALFGQKLAEYERLVGKFMQIVRHPVNEAIFNSVLGDIREFSAALAEQINNRDNGEKLRNEVSRLRQLQESYESTITEMEAKANRANRAAETLSEFTEEKTTREWTEEYYPYVNSDLESDEKIQRLAEMFSRQKKNANFIKKQWLGLRLFFYKIYRLVFVDILFYNGKSYQNTVKRWRFWRSAWLFFIAIVAIGYLVVFWDYDIQKKGITAFWLDKSKFLPLLAVVTIGFTFSARNFKISSHLLEQYKHRYTVAKTMHNLMILDDLKGDQSMKSDVLQKGAKVLFEFRNTGYMNKSDNEQLTSKDLLELIKKES